MNKTLVLGLLQGPVTWAAAGAAVAAWISSRTGVPVTSTIGVSLFAGTTGWASAWLLLSVVQLWRERAAIRGGAAGVAPADGRRAIVVGMLNATGPVLRAPLDGAPSLIYTYQIDHVTGTGKRRFITAVARGAALTPSTISTRTGVYRLLVVPELDGDVPPLTRSQMIANFKDFAARTSFMPRTKAADELLAQWDDADGEYRSDIAYVELTDADTSHWVLTQRQVPPGAQVCLFGQYSAARGGIVPSVGIPARLLRGDAEQVAASLRSTIVTRGILAVVFGAATAGVIALAVANR